MLLSNKKIEEDFFENLMITLTFGTGMAALFGPINEFINNYTWNMNNFHMYMLLISYCGSLISHTLSIKTTIVSLFNDNPTKSIEILIWNIYLSILLILNELYRNIGKGICSLLEVLSYTSVFIPTMDLIKNTEKYTSFGQFIPLCMCIILFVTSYYLKKCILSLNK